MSLKEKINKRAYPALLASLVLMAAYIQINIMLKIEINIPDVLLGTLVIILTVFLVDYFSRSPEFCIVSGMLSVVGIFLLWCFRDEVKSFITSDKRIWIFGIMMLVGIVLYISQQFFLMRIIVCVGYWGAMVFLIFINLFPVRQVMFCLAAELVLVVIEIINRRSREKKADSHKKMFFLSPIVLIVFLVLSVMPYSTKPIDWEPVYEWLEEKFKKNAGIGDEQIGFAGYSESANLRGDKIVVDKETLQLTMLGNTEHVYLIGNIKSDYTGDGWVGNPKNTGYKGNYTEYEFDAVEFLYAMYRAGVIDGTVPADEGGKSTGYLRLREITIEYDGMKTSSLFRPAKTMRINTKEYDGEILDRKEDISFSKKQDRDTIYTLKYFSVNRGRGVATNLLKAQSKYVYNTMTQEDYENFRRIVNLEYRTMGLPDTNDFEKELAERAAYIRATYLAVPDGITEKTYNLAQSITKNCETDYDKMEKIVSYLAEYEYTVTPGEIPQGEDVVEYFLFKLKKGYCTHYASAAAILGRCVGIPTRFVQGYLLDVERMGQYGRYTVNENQAHAWIECYLEGVGWLTFDPTPGSTYLLHKDWGIPGFADNNNGGPDNDNGIDDTNSGVIYDDRYESEDGIIDKTENEDSEVLVNSNNDIEQDDSVRAVKRNGLIVIGIIVVFFVVLLFLNIRQSAFWESYEAASYAERLRVDLLMVLWILKREGYTMKKEETLRAYFKRVSGFFPEKAKLMNDVNNLYEQVRYGKNDNVTQKEQRMSERLRLSFTSEKINMTALTNYGRKILKSKFLISKI